MSISERELEEFFRVTTSESFRKDMEYISTHRHNPFIKDGKVDVDAYIEFLTFFNEFINHKPKPFQPIVGDSMKL